MKVSSECIYWDKKNRKWLVIVTINSKRKNIGRFVSIEDALTARDESGWSRKLLFGVGINDANYDVNSSDGKCIYYQVWKRMIERVFCKKYQEKRPTYKGCSMDNQWLSFMNFKEWALKQGDITGLCLDKDILKQGNKIYSPEFCVFVSKQVNTILGGSDSARGDYPLGVCEDKGSFSSSCCVGGGVRVKKTFKTQALAHSEWQSVKLNHIEKVAKTQKENIKNALMLRVDQLRNDLESGRETIKL